jgi:DNA polymerase-3 subunit gamma/tau
LKVIFLILSHKKICMENFIVSARKYRPETFESVVGQENITITLKNAIKSNHLGHAYLFCGPRGVGKTTCARIFAKTINCNNLTDKYEACNECESCTSFNDTRAFNIHELDAASNNSVDDIRNLIEQVRIPPQVGNYSTYIIDEVHMLSAQAFNAFLKTLEEPPRHAIFILATTEKHKIIPTILSRCQIFDFQRIKVADIVQYLEKISKNEGIEYELDAFNSIANKVDGSMRDALSIFDQLVSFAGSKITYNHVIENLNILDFEYYFRLTQAFLENKLSEVLLIFSEILDKGFDGHHFISGLSNHFRDLLVCKDPSTIELLDVGAGIGEKYKSQSQTCEEAFLFQALEICSAADIHYKLSRNQRLHVELALIKLCNITENKKKTVAAAEDASTPDDEQSETAKDQEDSDQESQSAEIEKETHKAGPDEIRSPDPSTGEQFHSEPNKRKNLPSTSYSIKDALNGNNQKDIVNEHNEQAGDEPVTEETEPFAEEDIHREWNAFTESLKSERPRMYSTLKSHLPTVGDDYRISLMLDNTTQKDEFARELKQDITRFLQKNLKNHKISIELTVKPDDTEKALLYTAEEKFEYMNKKNSYLGKLKQHFNLDFE